MIVDNYTPVQNSRIATTCPLCLTYGIFSDFAQDVQIDHFHIVGMRFCTQCRTLIFVIIMDGKVMQSYPPITIPFDSSNIPGKISHFLAEAIKCHTNQCFTAAAIMVRRTLEEICHTENAQGPNLVKRIDDLKSKFMLPAEFFEAMHDLRLLGNDAAHIELKSFDNIGAEESEAAIICTKELLKACYQYKSIIGQLKSLKKSKQGAP